MSLELHVFLRKSDIPSRDQWQKAIDGLSLPIVLDKDLNAVTNSGFLPVAVNGVESGFELYHDDPVELISSYTDLHANVGNRNAVMTFRWGGDLLEGGSALGAAAAIVRAFSAIAYNPQDGIIYTEAGQLVSEAQQCFDMASRK
jgi:hypothetical protein